jgi:hypothetical protein
MKYNVYQQPLFLMRNGMFVPMRRSLSLIARSPSLVNGLPELAVADAMGRVTLYTLDQAKVRTLNALYGRFVLSDPSWWKTGSLRFLQDRSVSHLTTRAFFVFSENCLH